jgi:two-component system, LuxR family, response regulator FixJ
MPWVEALTDPPELRRCFRDLMALSMLPAIWTNCGPQEIADRVAAALVSMLGADFIYIAVPTSREHPMIEVVHVGKKSALGTADAIRRAIAPEWFGGVGQTALISNPFGEGTARIATGPIGFAADAVLVAGSAHPDFPNETQRLLLSIAANNTTIALQRWREAQTQEESDLQRLTQYSDSPCRTRRSREGTMPAEKPVYVVDDDAAVRRSLERLLNSAGFKAISYATPMAFLDAVPGLSGGCVLLDLRMPGLDGLTVQARLVKLESLIPVIVMTCQGDVQAAVRAMKAGAIDVLEKPFDDDTLLNAIEAALTRSEWLDRDSEALDATERLASLSRREREVLGALLAGRSSKLIAYDLGISVRTVEVHRARMMDRLGVRQLAAAIRLAVMARMTPHATRRPVEK